MRGPLFPLGRCVATPGFLALGINPSPFLIRHGAGDWGDLDPEDKQANDAAVINGDRILSAYQVGEHKFWIITEADRSVTTVLLPSEY